MTVTTLARTTPPWIPAALRQAAGLLDSEATARLIAATTDLSFLVDDQGVIGATAFTGSDLAEDGVSSWQGRSWADTVTVESRPKVESLLRDAVPGAIGRWRQVNHPSPRGIDLPVRYATIRPRPDGPIIVLGRDLRSVAALQRRLVETQQALDRDYERLRAAETRYKLLFQLSGEPVLIVDIGTRRVTEANAAASRRLGRVSRRIVGQDAVELFETDSAREVQGLFAGLRSTGQAAELTARLAGGRGEARVSVSLFRSDRATSVLLRLSPEADDAGSERPRGEALDVVAQMPEAFVVTDTSRRILLANAAFLDLAQLATEEQARGESLERWLGREETEADALFSALRDHETVRHFPTVVRGAYGLIEEVEVAGVAVQGGVQPCLGFTLRTLPRRPDVARNTGTQLPRSVEQMTELVGRVSMKTLVRETTDLIEKLCIEAALRITRDNRASAAEILGLSRQGLYAKMRRYGVGDLTGSDGEEPLVET